MGYTNFNMRLDDDVRGQMPICSGAVWSDSPAQAVRMFSIRRQYWQVHSLDWWESPNKVTLEAMKELENGGRNEIRHRAEAVREMQKLADGGHE